MHARPKRAVIQRAVVDLSVGQRNSVRQALARAIALCELVVSKDDAALGPVCEHYIGRPTASRLLGLRADFQTIAAALQAVDPDRVDYDDQTDAFAYVDAADATRITLGATFFRAAEAGLNSRAGTLIHEASHWTGVRGTRDHAYGDPDDGDSALIEGISFAQRRNNADSLERIAEAFQ